MKKKIFNDEIYIRIQLDKYDKKWIEKEAMKRKLSLAGLIRHWINYFKNETK